MSIDAEFPRLLSLLERGDEGPVRTFLETLSASRGMELADAARRFAELGLSSGRHEASRYLLELTVEAAAGPQAQAEALVRAGELSLTHGSGRLARHFYSFLELDHELLERIGETFVAAEDLEELFDLLEGGEEPRAPDDPVAKTLAAAARRLCGRLAGEGERGGQGRRLFRENRELLGRLDPHLTAGELPEPEGPAGLFVGRVLYLRGADGSWKRFRPDAGSEIVRHIRELDDDFYVRISTPETLYALLEFARNDRPGVVRRGCYVVIDFGLLARLATVADLKPLAECRFSFLFLDEGRLEEMVIGRFLSNNYNLTGHILYGNEEDRRFCRERLTPVLEEMGRRVSVALSGAVARLQGYYDESFDERLCTRLARISQQPPTADGGEPLRILLLTSRFSTFLQYCTRDLAHGFEALGHQARILMESEHDNMGIRHDNFTAELDRFHPDALVNISHFRNPYVPARLPYVCWIQDKTAEVIGGASLDRLTERDILLTQTFYDELQEIGYRDLIRFPVPVNEWLFRGEPHRHPFEAGISYVNHAPSAELELSADPARNRTLVKRITRELGRKGRMAGREVVSLNDYKEALRGIFGEAKIPDMVYEHIRDTIGNYLSRIRVLEWLVEGDYRPALYGNGWEKLPSFAPFAKGAAHHGEALARIYNRSRINLHVHPYTTTHQRVFEVIASGGFLLISRIPPERDLNPIGQYLQEGEGYLFFDGKEELYAKLDWLLADDQARLEIIRKGMARVAENYTYRQSCTRLIEILRERLCP